MAPDSETLRYENPALWSTELWDSLEYDRQRAQIIMASLPITAHKVLDVGCGNGVFTNLTREKTNIYGTDRSYAALRQVSSPRCQASAHALPFNSNSFDAVVCMEMLEHLPVGIFPMTLVELARISSDLILITVPYRENLRLSRISCPACECEFHPYYHMRSFEYSDLIHLFDAETEIQVENISGICPAPVRRFPILWEKIRGLYHRGGANFPWYARCPQCGYSNSKSINEPEMSAGPQQNAKKYLKNLWPRTQRPQWWFATYRWKR